MEDLDGKPDREQYEVKKEQYLEKKKGSRTKTSRSDSKTIHSPNGVKISFK